MIRQLYYLKNYLFYFIRFFGSDIKVHYSAYVSCKAIIRVVGGGKVRIGPKCELNQFSMLLTYGGDIILGESCSVNPFTIIYGHGGTTIGKGVRIAAHSTIIPANHILGDENKPLFKRGVTVNGISIGDYSWIGTGCRILDGVNIGRHAVLGAGSVVNKSIPDFTIAVGVPAKVIKNYKEN
jgi:acetyltransferase-like isoleucine patch superfamily enzyme